MFTHLQVHSCYSLLYGPRTPAEIAAAARASGFEALALTDINSLYGVHAFINACVREGLQPIVGAELRHGGERAVVLVKTREGFSHLTQILTGLKMRKDFNLARSLADHGRDLTILTESDRLLETLAGKGHDLYALITPFTQKTVRAARRLSLPLAAAGDVTFLSREDWAVHRVLRAVAEKSAVPALKPETLAPADALLFPVEDAGRLFSDYPEAIANVEKIASGCRFHDIFNGFIFPEYGEKGRSAALLRRRVYAGAEQRYGELSETVVERIEYELGIIEAKGFSPYFLIVADIVSRASRTCGRGSGAASIVSYSLGITNVDPIRHNLYFERFLNPERKDPPDIDIDFAWDERDEIIASVMSSYGTDYAAMVCTHIHFKARSAIRETARVFGMPDSEIAVMEKSLFRFNSSPELDASWREILRLAERVKGLPRHLGVHVGGVVLTPRPVSYYAPVERAPKGVPVIAWDKDDAERAGLVKIDLLGNRSLAVVRDALANLACNGITIDPHTWNPIDDEKTKTLLAEGRSMGVFYVESPAMRQLQKKTGRGDFEHLVIHSSIIRPAANKFIAEYVRRLKGGAYVPLHPDLEHILSETYGIMVYQEDVSKAAIALAGFSSAEADGLRKILSKKDRDLKLAEYRKKFFSQAASRSVSIGVIEKIWEMIGSFDGYSFCKPHSASYAMVSFQSAYLKAHHPAEFMAAVLSNGGGYYSALAYVSECGRMGLAIHQPDVNQSALRYTGKEGVVRVGLSAIRRLRAETMIAIVREREAGGPYADLEDFVHRVDLSQPDAGALAASGALDSISGGRSRREQLWDMALCRFPEPTRDAAPRLFTGPIIGAGRSLKRASRIDILKNEYLSLGFICGAHPMVLWEKSIASVKRKRAVDLPRLVGREATLVGWLVTRKEVLTAKGEPMEFVSFEDESDIFETVLFPRAYLAFSDELDEPRPFLIRGKVEDDNGAVSVTVRHVENLPA